MSVDPTDKFEPVHALWNWWDGPRNGVADYRGTAHVFECVFDEEQDDWSTTFLLKPIQPSTLEFVREKNTLWARWLGAHHRKSRTDAELMAHFPVLSEDRPRYDEIVKAMAHDIAIDPQSAIRAQARFVQISPRTADAERVMSVCWTRLAP